jgi:MtN3 and saliva related transmembrane protein
MVFMIIPAENVSVGIDLTEILGLAAGICTSFSLLPQLIKLIREKEAENLSLFYLITLFVGIGLWIWYGFLREDVPIVLTNACSLALNVSIIVASLKYKRKAL